MAEASNMMASVAAAEVAAPSILLVDDHAPNLLALEAILAPLSCRLVRCTSGDEALKRLLHEEFAVILLDVMMPGLDGLQTAALVKQREKSRRTPIIFLSALDREPGELALGYSLGAVDYLVKPFHPDILRAKVSVFVELFRNQQELSRQAEVLREREREGEGLRRSVRRAERARVAAEASQETYRFLAESIPQQVWTARPDGALDFVSSVVVRYFDETPEAILGAGWQEFIHPADLSNCIARWTRSLTTGEAYEVEFRLRRFDGVFRWHLGRALPMRDGEGRVVRWFGTNTDIDDRITAEAELRQQQERFQLLTEVLPQIVWAISADGGTAYLSPRWYHYTGQSPSDPLEVKWRGAIHPDDFDACFRAWEAARVTRTTWQFEYRLRGRDGVYRWHLGRSAPHCDADGNILTWYGGATDIDEQRRAIKSRDDLLATVSHDLRNPLGGMTLVAAVLRKMPGSEPQMAALAKHAGTIERAARRMEHLVRDLLDMASIESGHLSVEPRPLEAAALVDEALETIQPLATEKELRVETVVPAPRVEVHCDRGRVLQVFTNLLGNAVKFTPAAGRIAVGAEPVERYVRFAVSDTGPGIRSDQLPFVFDRFWQAKETARAGTGLGLAICKGIIQQHGGDIWVESQVGVGTTFFFTLPRADASSLS